MKILLFILLCTSYLFAQKYISIKEDDKWGFKNRNTGKEIIPCKYESALSVFSNHYFCVKLNGKWGIIDTNDKILIPFVYDGLNYDRYSEVDFCFARIGGEYIENQGYKGAKWGFITPYKEITPIKYGNLHSFENERALVRFESKWGFIDTFGNFSY